MYKRKRSSPVSSRKRRRTMNISRPRISKSVNRQVHKFRRTGAGFAVSGGVGQLPWLGYTDAKLSYMSGSSEFAALFDEYRITHMQIKVFLRIDPSAQTAATASYPRLYSSIDHNDVSTPASLNELRERGNCRVQVLNPNRPVILNVKPSVLGETYRSAIATTYTPKWRVWLPTTNLDVPHYGIKFGIDDLTNTNYRVDSEITYWFQCKNSV